MMGDVEHIQRPTFDGRDLLSPLLAGTDGRIQSRCGCICCSAALFSSITTVQLFGSHHAAVIHVSGGGESSQGVSCLLHNTKYTGLYLVLFTSLEVTLEWRR